MLRARHTIYNHETIKSRDVILTFMECFDQRVKVLVVKSTWLRVRQPWVQILVSAISLSIHLCSLIVCDRK